MFKSAGSFRNIVFKGVPKTAVCNSRIEILVNLTGNVYRGIWPEGKMIHCI